MTFTIPSIRVTGELITASIWNSDLVTNLIALYNSIVAVQTLTVHEITAAQASLDVTDIPQTGGDLIISGILRPVTDDVALFLRLNGRSGASDYRWVSYQHDPTSDAADSEIHLVTGLTAANGVGNSVDEGANFEIHIPAYADVVGSIPQYSTAKVTFRRPDGSLFGTAVYGMLAFAEPIDQITLLFESGDIAEGMVRVRTTRGS